MNNYQDNQEVSRFIDGMKHSVRDAIEGNQFPKIPDTIIYLISKVEDGEVMYGMGGGAVPEDEIGRELIKSITPKIMEHEGHRILCTCEAIKVNGEMKLKFINHITNDETFEIIPMEKKTYKFEELFTNISLN